VTLLELLPRLNVNKKFVQKNSIRAFTSFFSWLICWGCSQRSRLTAHRFRDGPLIVIGSSRRSLVKKKERFFTTVVVVIYSVDE
jgi:hypothetical protein